MKHIKKFNETLKDDVKHEILSTFKASGNLIKYENDIKNDIIFYIYYQIICILIINRF